MPSNTVTTDRRPRNEEKLFLVLVLALAVIAAAGSWFAATALAHRDHLHGELPDKPRALVDFSLTDSTGRVVSRDELKGKFLVVSFLFTTCSLTCPEVTKRMAEIQRLTADQPDVRLLSLTVDPRSDTPPVLAKWGLRFGYDSSRWHMLTGDKAQLHGLIAESFLPQDNSDPFNSMPGNFTGTDRIALVDRHGRVHAYFDGLRVETPKAVVTEIARLRNEP